MTILSYIILTITLIFLLGLFVYLLRGPGSSGYYRRGRRYK